MKRKKKVFYEFRMYQKLEEVEKNCRKTIHSSRNRRWLRFLRLFGIYHINKNLSISKENLLSAKPVLT